MPWTDGRREGRGDRLSGAHGAILDSVLPSPIPGMRGAARAVPSAAVAQVEHASQSDTAAAAAFPVENQVSRLNLFFFIVVVVSGKEEMVQRRT